MEGNQNKNFKRETKVSGEPKNEEWNQKYRKGSKIKFLKETKKITKKFWHIWAIVLQICFYLFMTCFMLTFFIFFSLLHLFIFKEKWWVVCMGWEVLCQQKKISRKNYIGHKHVRYTEKKKLCCGNKKSCMSEPKERWLIMSTKYV